MSRKMLAQEFELISLILSKTRYRNLINEISLESEVDDMDDDGMGGVVIYRSSTSERIFGGRVAEARYVDSDGVPVLIGLNLDQDGHLFELEFFKDYWKKLVTYPKPRDVEIIVL